MFIKQLIIEKDNGDVIRNIIFQKGLNLIIDETPSEDEKKSGNNIGKTTLLKLIDFCLGGDADKIYKEKESLGTNNTHNSVKNFLEENGVCITLILTPSLDDDSSTTIKIERNFLKKEKKIYKINGDPITNDKDAAPLLSKLVFSHTDERPTFRQIISKNIRYEDYRLSYIAKTVKMAKDNEYEALFFFWFGIPTDLAATKDDLLRKKRQEELFQKRLKESAGREEIVIQKLKITQDEIDLLEKERANLNVNENYQEDLETFVGIQNSIGETNTKIISLNTRIDLIKESKEKLEKNKTNIDIETIKNLYQTAKTLLPNLHKSFEETVSFHNDMLKNKINFITSELPGYEQDLRQQEEILKNLLNQEQYFKAVLQKNSTYEEKEQLIINLNKMHEEKGKLEQKLIEWQNSQEKLTSITVQLKEISDENDTFSDIIEKNISDFNKYLTEFSNALYDERFFIALALDENSKNKSYKIDIQNYDGSPLGKGKKIGHIAVFDLAYVSFADAHSIKCLHFILHDDVEKVHDNQISKIPTIVNKVNCQYIISALKDKLPKGFEKYSILTLSENDKLFRF